MMPRLITNFVVLTSLFLVSETGLACYCTISAENLNFGTYDVLSNSDTDANSRITVDCDATRYVRVELSRGISGSYNARQMSNGIGTALYNIYTDSSRVTIWGDGSGSTGTRLYSLTAYNHYRQSKDAYGRVPHSQLLSPGDYADTITASFEY